MATHWPIVAAFPGASVVDLGAWGIRLARWDYLHLVSVWRRFLTEPASCFGYLPAAGPAGPGA